MPSTRSAVPVLVPALALVLSAACASPALAQRTAAPRAGVLRIHTLHDAIEHMPHPIGFRREREVATDGEVVRWSERAWTRAFDLGPAPSACVLRLRDSTAYALYDNPHVFRRLALDSLRARFCARARAEERWRAEVLEAAKSIESTCRAETVAARERIGGVECAHLRLTASVRHRRMSEGSWSPPATGPDTLDFSSVASLDVWTQPRGPRPAPFARAIEVLGGESLAVVPGLAETIAGILGVDDLPGLPCGLASERATAAVRAFLAGWEPVRALGVAMSGPTQRGADSLRAAERFRELVHDAVALYADSGAWTPGVERALDRLCLRHFPDTGSAWVTGTSHRWPNLHVLNAGGPSVMERTIEVTPDGAQRLDVPAWMPEARPGDLWEPCPAQPRRTIDRRSLRV